MIWQSAEDGQWYWNTDGRNIPFDTEQEAKHAMAVAEQKSGEQEIVEQANALIPVLRDALMRMQALANLWAVEDIGAVIAEHKVTGEDIADHPVAYFEAIGTVFTELLTFMGTPIESIQQTPNEVLTRRNWRKL